MCGYCTVSVGQNIGKDVEWCQLERGVDFGDMIDLAPLFRVFDSNTGKYQYFRCQKGELVVSLTIAVLGSQTHVCGVWLGDTEAATQAHDAVGDAQKSMTLFHAYGAMQMDPNRLMQLQYATLMAPKKPSFAMQHPEFEGVCQGNRKLCKCGAPFFG